MFKVINFMDGNKWFVMAETIYNNEVYKYLIKIKNDEFEDKFLLVKYITDKDGEYIEKVTDTSVVEKVMVQMLPEIKPIIDNKDKLLKYLNK